MSIGLPDNAAEHHLQPATDTASVLVVDEDPAFQLGLKTFLREYVGFDQVLTARSGREAIERILSDESIEVVTLDYQMPGMTGIDVLEELADRLDRPVSFLMITGYPSDSLERTFRGYASLNLLTRHFLAKPVEFEKLEPILLRAHGEVRAAKEEGILTAVPEKSEEDASEGFASVRERLDQLEIRLDEIESRVAGLRRRWRFDFLLVIVIAALVFAALRFGWMERLEDFGDRIVEDARAALPGLFETRDADSAEPAPDAEGSESGPE